MNRVKAFGKFWYGFIIGDDWKIAVGVVCGLGIGAIAAHADSQVAWYVVPIAAIAALVFSLRAAIRK